MEITCTRCHQTVQPGDCYCPVCGLPQLVYDGESAGDPAQPGKWNEVIRDAGSIDWKPGLRYALLLALPAGVLSALLSSVNVLGPLLMAVTGALVVALYMRNRTPSWITLGAGARLGLVTGVLGGWSTLAASGIALYTARYWFHQGPALDGLLTSLITESSQQVVTWGVDPQSVATMRVFLLSPSGRAAQVLSDTCFLALALLVFAVAGAALGARILARTRRPQS